MRKIVMKYESLIEDGQGDTKSERYVEILDLTSQIQELKIVLSKKSTYQERNSKINVGKTRFENSGTTWKSTALTSGKSWTKEKNGRTFPWCKWHEYWTETHNSIIAECNTIPQKNKSNSTKSTDKNYWISIWHLLKVITWLMKFLVWPHLWRQIITLNLMKLIESFIGTQYIVMMSNILPLMIMNS